MPVDPSLASTLKDLGFAGYVISALMTAVGGLSAAVVIQWKQSLRVNKDRLAERDILNSALSNAVTTVNSVVQRLNSQEETMEDMTDAIAGWTSSLEVLKERLANHHEANSEKLRDLKFVVESFSEAVRTLTGITTDIRNWTQSQLQPRPRR